MLADVAEVSEIDNIFARGGGAAQMGSRSNLSARWSPKRLARKPAENPGLLIRQLSFEKFRTAGMRRTMGEGSNERFITPARLLKLLQGTRRPGTLVDDATKAPESIIDSFEWKGR